MHSISLTKASVNPNSLSTLAKSLSDTLDTFFSTSLTNWCASCMMSINTALYFALAGCLSMDRMYCFSSSGPRAPKFQTQSSRLCLSGCTRWLRRSSLSRGSSKWHMSSSSGAAPFLMSWNGLQAARNFMLSGTLRPAG